MCMSLFCHIVSNDIYWKMLSFLYKTDFHLLNSTDLNCHEFSVM